MAERMSATKAVMDHKLDEKVREGQMPYNQIRFLEPLVTLGVKHAASKLGTSFAGLEYAAKTGSSVSDKLTRGMSDADIDKLDVESELLEMKDLIRYTELCDHDNIADVTRRTIREMENQGYVLSMVKNYYAHPFKDTDYMGIHLNFISPYGQVFELQVHSPESFDAKQRGHSIYEMIRSESAQTHEKEFLLEKVRAIHHEVPLPNGILAIQDFKLDPLELDRIIGDRKAGTEVDVDSVTLGSGAEITTYQVVKDEQQLFFGFEAVFPDKSAWCYQYDMTKDDAQLHSLSISGETISNRNAKPVVYDIDKVKQMLDIQMKLHAKWMQEHMPETLRGMDDVGIDLSVSTPMNERVSLDIRFKLAAAAMEDPGSAIGNRIEGQDVSQDR